MARAFLIVMDSVGCGGAEDAAAYGDEGADTLGHIAEFCAAGLGDRVAGLGTRRHDLHDHGGDGRPRHRSRCERPVGA